MYHELEPLDTADLVWAIVSVIFSAWLKAYRMGAYLLTKHKAVAVPVASAVSMLSDMPPLSPPCTRTMRQQWPSRMHCHWH